MFIFDLYVIHFWPGSPAIQYSLYEHVLHPESCRAQGKYWLPDDHPGTYQEEIPWKTWPNHCPSVPRSCQPGGCTTYTVYNVKLWYCTSEQKITQFDWSCHSTIVLVGAAIHTACHVVRSQYQPVHEIAGSSFELLWLDWKICSHLKI